ncbi:translation initiation factor IF-3 isoform X2 [Parasteatoda tepidariorum]|uniref:translation initiation factor IF-3 isoform X2 n=1 Tax=Parasteatoda tepidariorum TaxID=114398 RepID=UPI001C721061|nr:uncharacterized protein LOC107436761 isoform X2 [Parasteatoda tepidariorum]
MLKIFESCRKINYIARHFSINYVLRNCEEQPKIENQGVKKPKRKITETVELVTLVDQNDKILGLKPKSESEKLARKLNLSLTRVFDTKFGKVYPAYKLMSSTEVLKTESKTSSAKTLKKLPLSSRISDHDLKVKIQTIRKWVVKNCEVHVAITGNAENMTAMFIHRQCLREKKNTQLL